VRLHHDQQARQSLLTQKAEMGNFCRIFFLLAPIANFNNALVQKDLWSMSVSRPPFWKFFTFSACNL